MVKCLHNRARGIINMQDNIQKEVDHLARVLKLNCYLANFIPPMLLSLLHKKQQTPAARTGDRRRRRDFWW